MRHGDVGQGEAISDHMSGRRETVYGGKEE